jgi:hypothetical protein
LETHHNLTMTLSLTHKNRSWKKNRQNVSDNVVCTERDKLGYDNIKDNPKFTDVVPVNVDVSGVFTTDWISKHDSVK